ncbi:hypothetical protein VZ94_14915 [Methylocucumis oryzae]|uniref:Putative Flp pilus-assembly TadG-like N-terminal domain-containing protein n=2 Tax=Methylocucumis oryzae TaxID=1632867 RepID=A0A0F3IGK4_9GAMM|nr:hypothetical protein VZ94_14915 [Methylocucumis oryzae]
MKHQNPITIKQQQGVVWILTLIVLPVLLALLAFVLNFSHVYLNQAKLQNAVDAAALSAAESLNNGLGNDALVDGVSAFNQTLTGGGNQELLNAGVLPDISFSHTVNPYDAWTADPFFVRVSATYTQDALLLAGFFGIDNITITASAIAGPSSFSAGPVPPAGTPILPTVLYPEL